MPAKTIVIFSTKGGVGKTFLASNLAVSLASAAGKKTCLLDLDLQAAGDMSRMLNIKPQRCMVDLMHVLKEYPQQEFDKRHFLQHTSYGADFLPGLLKPQQAPHFDTQKIKPIFEFLDKEYDFLIVDVGKNFSDVFLSILNQSNLILLVVTPDILSVYQTKWALDTLQFLHFPLRMVKVILNRAESLSSISWHEVKTSLPCDILAMLPSEGKIVGQSINRGVPVVVESPRSKIAQALEKLSIDLAGKPELFLERRELDQLKAQETAPEATGAFWQEQGMIEPPQEIDIRDELDDILRLKRRVHSRLIEELNIKRLDPKVFSDPKKSKELKDRAEMIIANLLAEEAKSFLPSTEVRRKLVREILDEALALGPLEDLLADETISDIMVNNKNEVYIERNGKIVLTSKKFISNEQVKIIIERIIAPIGRRIDESVPMVDARLPDGSRVNAIIPPLALTGPTLTIRKFRKERLTAEDLVSFKTLNSIMAEFLKACVACRKNVIISGGTGSGKTTVLNVISNFVENSERIISIEDAAELRLHQDHWIRLESRPANIEGRGSITIRDLFRNTLRMRPDRIIIGECRGVETLDMLQAMNTGHDGSMTTVHANSTQDALSRLDSLILMSGVELPLRSIREMIASAVDMIVHTARLSDGTRKIIQITEIAGMTDEVHMDLKDIFMFRQTGVDKEGHILGDFHATGYVPSFFDEVKIRGFALSRELFAKS